MVIPARTGLDYTFDLVGITDSGYKWKECISGEQQPEMGIRKRESSACSIGSEV
jgi:hypothetical protein